MHVIHHAADVRSFCTGCPRRWPATDIVVDADSDRVYWQGRDANVTTGEFRIIAVMVANRGTFLRYRALYDSLRGEPGFIAGHGTRGHEANMRSAIKRIRRKFLAIDPQWDEIENYVAFGYRWRDR
jgi:two-component system response regulator ChvI